MFADQTSRNINTAALETILQATKDRDVLEELDNHAGDIIREQVNQLIPLNKTKPCDRPPEPFDSWLSSYRRPKLIEAFNAAKSAENWPRVLLLASMLDIHDKIWRGDKPPITPKTAAKSAGKKKKPVAPAPKIKTLIKPATTRSAPKKPAAKKPAAKKTAAFMALMYPSPSLAVITGAKAMPRTDVTSAIWAYIKKHGLQDKKNPRMVNTNPALAAVLGGRDQVTMFEMTKLISAHLASTAEKAAKIPAGKAASGPAMTPVIKPLIRPMESHNEPKASSAKQQNQGEDSGLQIGDICVIKRPPETAKAMGDDGTEVELMRRSPSGSYFWARQTKLFPHKVRGQTVMQQSTAETLYGASELVFVRKKGSPLIKPMGEHTPPKAKANQKPAPAHGTRAAEKLAEKRTACLTDLRAAVAKFGAKVTRAEFASMKPQSGRSFETVFGGWTEFVDALKTAGIEQVNTVDGLETLKAQVPPKASPTKVLTSFKHELNNIPPALAATDEISFKSGTEWDVVIRVYPLPEDRWTTGTRSKVPNSELFTEQPSDLRTFVTREEAISAACENELQSLGEEDFPGELADTFHAYTKWLQRFIDAAAEALAEYHGKQGSLPIAA